MVWQVHNSQTVQVWIGAAVWGVPSVLSLFFTTSVSGVFFYMDGISDNKQLFTCELY